VSLTTKLTQQFKAEFAGRIIAVISGAVLTVTLARLLNPDGYGLLYLALSIFGTIKLLSKLGIAKSAARYITKYKETDPGQIPHILAFSLLLNVTTIVIACAFLLLGHEFLAILVGEPELAPLLALGIFFVAFATLATFVRHILQGFEDIESSAILYASDSVTRLIFAVGLVALGYGAIGGLIGYILAHAVVSIIGLAYIYTQYYREISPTDVEDGIRRRITEYAFPLTASSTANVLDKRVDTILVGFFIGATGVGYYTIGKQVLRFIEAPISALGFTLSPSFEAQKAKGNTKAAAKLYEESLIYSLLLYLPAAAGLALIAGPMVELVFGAEYLGAVIVLQVLSIYAVLDSMVKLTGNGLDFLGRARDRAIVKGITSVLNVGLNIILIPWFGVVGAAIATVVTYSIYTFVSVYIMYLEIPFNLKFVFTNISKIIAITSVMSASIYFLVPLISGFVTLLLVVGMGVLIWAALTIGTGVADTNQIIPNFQ
jgi:O-antigen/teichoic acid export membrane protein